MPKPEQLCRPDPLLRSSQTPLQGLVKRAGLPALKHREVGRGGGGGGKTHALVSPTPTDVANLLFRLTHPHTHLWLLGKSLRVELTNKSLRLMEPARDSLKPGG